MTPFEEGGAGLASPPAPFSTFAEEKEEEPNEREVFAEDSEDDSGPSPPPPGSFFTLEVDADAAVGVDVEDEDGVVFGFFSFLTFALNSVMTTVMSFTVTLW